MLLWIVVAAGVGIAICLQGATNGVLGARIGIAATVAVSLAIALGGALAVWYWSPRAPERTQPIAWWMWLGGLYGLCILAGAAFVFPRLGVAPTTALVVAAQLLTSLWLDHTGWFGERVAVSPARLLGAALLLGGALLVLWPRLRA
jgi:transporter family-2 protein